MHERLIEMFKIVDAGRFDDLREYYSLESEYERPGFPVLKGQDAIVDFYKFARVIGSGTHNIEGVIQQEVRCCCWGRFTGLSRGGEPLDERFCDVYEVVDGKINRRLTHFFRAAI